MIMVPHEITWLLIYTFRTTLEFAETLIGAAFQCLNALNKSVNESTCRFSIESY